MASRRSSSVVRGHDAVDHRVRKGEVIVDPAGQAAAGRAVEISQQSLQQSAIA
jgi:hypothetical protein